MKTLAIDCRMARMSGIGVYLRNLAPLCMEMLADGVKFRLLGHDGAFRVPKGPSWKAVPFDAPIYSIAEQYRMPPLLRGCDALWLPHYPVPLLTRTPLVATIHDVAHLALPDLFTGVQKVYARLMDIRVLDHLIIGRGEYISFAEHVGDRRHHRWRA